jgi:hypothetical protein
LRRLGFRNSQDVGACADRLQIAGTKEPSMKMPQQLKKWFEVDGELDGHMFHTYRSLRWGLAILAFFFPLGLWGIGKAVHGLDLQPSMSAYYFAADITMCATFPMRSIFVGALCAICAALYLYKGFSKAENVLLNLAAVFGVIVAIVPENLDDYQVKTCEGLRELAQRQEGAFPWHYVAAVSMFVCLALVCWTCATRTLKYLPSQEKSLERSFRWSYLVIGAFMVGFPAVGVIFNDFLRAESLVFFIELAGIWTFAAYWTVKSIELMISRADAQKLAEQCSRAAAQQPPPAPADLARA